LATRCLLLLLSGSILLVRAFVARAGHLGSMLFLTVILVACLAHYLPELSAQTKQVHHS